MVNYGMAFIDCSPTKKPIQEGREEEDGEEINSLSSSSLTS
jgi:hypothetical protein